MFIASWTKAQENHFCIANKTIDGNRHEKSNETKERERGKNKMEKIQWNGEAISIKRKKRDGVELI